MAPRGPAQRRQTQSQNEHVFALGKVGRKTGITIPDNGVRDEQGFEVLDDLFSSPDRELRQETNGRKDALSDDEQDEQDEQEMEIDDGSVLGPATTRKLQQGGRPSLPRARSPIKTNLNSPARQNPHLQPASSPTRGTVITTREPGPKAEVVARRLDFAKSGHDKTMRPNGQTKVNGASSHNKKVANGRSQSTRSNEESIPSDDSNQTADGEELGHEEEEEEEEEDEELELLDAGAVDGGDMEEDDFPEVPDQETEDEEPVEEPEPEPIRKAKAPGRRGRKPKATIEKDDEPDERNVEDEEPVKRKGRPKAAAKQREPTPVADPSPPPKASKRGRPARNSEDAEETTAESSSSKGAKRQKTSTKPGRAEQSTSSKAVAPAKEKSKPGRRRKSSGVGVDSPIQRGPPLPKSRGLVTVRREDTTGMKTTRSGRASFKPLEWWKGEHVEYDEEQENIFEDAGKRHFKMPTVKGIVRTEENNDSAPRRRGRPAGRKPGRPAAIVEEEETERDEWEYNPGRVAGEVVCWKAEHEFNPPGEEDEVEIIPEELAISENAIQLKDIKDATFKFAKTLTLPFFGSGIVDLPPGAEKRPKNSRMRHLVFFVHSGSVFVTIAQSQFTIAKGGMFFVPRGNEYWIRNETDRHSRLFFAQGCEVAPQLSEED